MKLLKRIFALLFVAGVLPLFAQVSGSMVNQKLPAWTKGCMDIHHINTGEGNCTFILMPDGTSMLLDAGTVDQKSFEKNNYPLKAIGARYSSGSSIQDDLIDYIKWATNTKKAMPKIDYVVISHFHSDHYGALIDLLPRMDVKLIIDRNYPSYDYPFDLRSKLKKDALFQRYLQVVDSHKYRMQSLQVGKQNQIALLNNPQNFTKFYVQNIKSNAELWDPDSNKIQRLFAGTDMLDFYQGGYNENPLSMALKFCYGKFDYYAGADNTGLQDNSVPTWFDVESFIAKAVGRVEAMVLDHHGNRDANNANFIETLDPKVAIQQIYSSDQPGQEVYYRLRNLGRGKDRLLFSTNMHEQTRITYGPWFQRGYQSFQGHVVLRVFAGGDTYKVYVLEEKKRTIKWESELLQAE